MRAQAHVRAHGAVQSRSACLPEKREMKTLVFLLAAGLIGTAMAQEYPTKPVRIIAAAQGGLTELMPRTLAAEMHKKTGQPWLIEQKLGAGGVIGAEYV